MTRATGWERGWEIARAAVAALIVVAVVAQAIRTIGGSVARGQDVATTVVNFFSFFTILSNVASAVVLLWAAVWFFARGARSGAREPRGLATVLACATTYMVVTGIVYNTLLRFVELPQGVTVWWSNEILHVVGPVFLLADLFLGPRRRALPWRAIAEVVVFPVVWVVYTLVRGPLTTNPVTGASYWYPYPFLDPHLQGGYGGVALYVVGIAVAIALVAWLVVAVGRRRGA